MGHGELIGRGRAADVYDLGDGRVLRRYRVAGGRGTGVEAAAMRHLRTHGRPEEQQRVRDLAARFS